MQDLNSTQENIPKIDKPCQLPPARPALQSLAHENLPQPVPIQSSNPQLLKIYSSEIFSFLEATELPFSIQPDYLQLQSEISHASRAFLIDWLVGIHGRFRLLQETLYITVNLVDRYLSKRMVTKKQLQLVGLTAIFIAAKYEEIYPPGLKEFLCAADQSFTKMHLLRMEVDMLKVTEFQITVPTAWRFMEKYPELTCNEFGLTAQYLLELGLIEYSMIKYKPSVQAASAIFLANSIISKSFEWKFEVPNEHDIKECVGDYIKIFRAAIAHPLKSVREKYCKKKLNVAKLEEEYQ